MKTPQSIIRAVRLALLPMAVAILSQSALAQYQWDADADGSNGANGGTGTWDAASTNWYNGTVNDVAFNGANAVFGGTAGTVDVTGTQDATGLTFNSAGYILQGAGTINLTGATPTISGVGPQVINTLLTGTSGFTQTGSSKAYGGNNVGLSGVVTMDGTPSLVIGRVNNSNAFGSSAAFADRLNIINGGFGSIVQLSNGIALPKYITNSGGFATFEILGNSSFTGPVSSAGGMLYQFAGPATTHTLTGSAGLGADSGSIIAALDGRLIVDAAAGGAVAYGLFLRDSATVQVNNGASLGSANVIFGGLFFGGVGTAPVLALNGSTVSNNAFYGDTASVQSRIENIAAGTSTFSGQLLNNGVADYEVTLRSTTSGTLDVSGNINDQSATATVKIGKAGFANTGTVSLSKADGNTYDGPTTVHSGVLLASNTTGSATGTGSVTVNTTATLGGTGLITPGAGNGVTIQSGGNLAPGASIGTLTVDLGSTTGEFTMDNGSTFTFELDSVGGTLAAPGSSDILSITGASTGDFNFAALGNTVNLSGSTSGVYKLFNTSLQDATLAGDTWDNLTYNLLTGEVTSGLTATGATFFVGTATNAAGIADAANIGDIYVQVIPEPNVTALLGIAFGGGFIWLRKRSARLTKA